MSALVLVPHLPMGSPARCASESIASSAAAGNSIVASTRAVAGCFPRARSNAGRATTARRRSTFAAIAAPTTCGLLATRTLGHWCRPTIPRLARRGCFMSRAGSTSRRSPLMTPTTPMTLTPATTIRRRARDGAAGSRFPHRELSLQKAVELLGDIAVQTKDNPHVPEDATWLSDEAKSRILAYEEAPLLRGSSTTTPGASPVRADGRRVSKGCSAI